ncbi:MAG: ABC transporter permease subunit [Mesorhizobium sp.]|uniref:Dipeptide ABC transporter permease DppC n=1 Tax=Mesorhizobium mediterraneum TaxID=43617 RepID=A0AB36RHH0_9HYPH|nr:MULTISPECIES: ABC transporter permease subunit [Mesorhizobium]AZO64701.1 ABC transporter permease subunit [Mesorhizobium sp. M6A.T.Cr.TU.016.01.1.1]PAQ03821.1 dipeptide ABC transporter permease DppC [Mesorhizobium mediterraneum]RUU30222.1 ABC transporter permease subunit [Mesorhizobium sp. M6A.T.Ce.TU.016.01.1.1]RUU38073.1 ABC transporter permease subunit [Mesorhizobium sp. M6A.T.Ce.TU.002.03.1.1]RUU97683.1 ABC transporter permease subunit [Mesorhizobium sp. M6A.T.Cr.TU.017.01.1.1]
MTDQTTAEATAASIPTGGRQRAFTEFWHYYSMNTGAVIGLVVFSALVLIAIFAPLVAPHSPDEQFRDALLTPPVWQEGGKSMFLLGTDAVGRDMLSRLIFGARFSLFIGLVVVVFSLTSGIILGVLAGYFRGWVDTLIMRVMDVILAFPSLLLALVLVAILGPGLFNAMLAIALVLQPHFARLTRAAVMAEKNREYVISAKVAGASHLRLMVKTILPNCMAPLIVQATLSFSNAILEAAALGFLGVGAQPPTPEWGTMLATAREFILRAPWVVTFPGLAILITVLAINLIGDGLRDAFDPKLKRS